MPMKRSGRPVAAARVVTEIEEVFDARIDFRAQQLVRFAQHGKFQVQALGDGFDGEIGARNWEKSVVVWMRPRIFELSASAILPFFDFAVEILCDRVPGASEETFLHVAQNHGVAAAGEDVRDAVAHGSRAEHGNCADCVDGHFISSRSGR